MADEPRLLLIVEDDASFAATLRRSFERRGYTVVSAAIKGSASSIELLSGIIARISGSRS